MKLQTVLVLLLTLALVGGVQAIPPLPYEFFGTITIDGTPAPVGTEVIAKINGTVVGNITTTAKGLYGGENTFDQRLVVNGNEEQLESYVTFYVGDRQADQKVKLLAGESQKLDLTFIKGQEGTIDASITPSPQGALPSEGGDTQKSPLSLLIPVGALGAVLLLKRRE